MQVSIPQSHIKAALCAAAKDDIRYYLNGALLEYTPTEARLVATNGAILIALRSVADVAKDGGNDGTGSIIIPRDALEAVARIKQPRGADCLVVIEGDGTRYTMTLCGLSVGFAPIDGEYPDYRRVFPEKFSGGAGHYDPEYLYAMQRAYKALGSAFAVTLLQNGESAAYVGFGGYPACGIIMPMRVDAVTPCTWVREPLTTSSPEPAAVAA